jgi:arsenite-transporting ATPase
LKLPFVTKDDVELNKFSDELIIRIGGYKRHILLPRQVASYDSVKAKLDDQYLNIVFEGEQNGKDDK